MLSRLHQRRSDSHHACCVKALVASARYHRQQAFLLIAKTPKVSDHEHRRKTATDRSMPFRTSASDFSVPPDRTSQVVKYTPGRTSAVVAATVS